MKRISYFTQLKYLVVILAFSLISGNIFATHAQSADITYQCLGGNQYRINVSFYRDCAGVAAPNTVGVNLSAASCTQNSNVTLTRLAGTGQDVTQVCNTITTQCNGGNYPGVQEYKYTAVVTLAAQCTDWVFSFSLCCRNNAINTINNPGGENIYVEAKLNNLNFPCNNSPSFTIPPVSYPCIGQTSCFNHGVIEPDGDSLYYSLLSPATGPTTSVTYIGGYSANQPLISSPAVTFNPFTGDICMTPSMLEVTVLAVKVEEWRNGVFVGSVVRDIQLRTVMCNNNVPTVSGINGTGQFSTTACVGSNLSFTIPAQDVNAGQTVTITWNGGIQGATFTSNNQQIPTGTFNWTPTAAAAGSIPHCFTATVRDNNCPLNGVQVYSFCITVSALNITTTASTANCGASNGSASVTVLNGTAPYTYQWTPNGGNNATANGLQAGVYSVNVTDASGCSTSQNVTIGSGAAPGNLNVTSTTVSCFNGTNGTATANVNGGQQPYSYQWSNGATTQAIQNLIAGTYQVNVTTANGCVSSGSITITQPVLPLSLTSNGTSVSCFGGNNGTVNVAATGGTTPYSYTWNTIPVQNSAIANNLTAGTYMVTVTDNNGCVSTDEVTITQPTQLSLNLNNQQNVSCNGNNNGILSVNVNGGTQPYNYNWNNGNFPNTSTLNNLAAGTYTLVVTDANGCSQTANYTITEPLGLTSTISAQSNISCYGFSNGSITTITQGGTAPYSYQWNNGATTSSINNLSQGSYSLTVTDANGCTNTLSSTLSAPNFPLSSSITPSAVSCFGGNNGQVTVATSGGTTPYTYQWNSTPIQTTSTASNLLANNYSVIITDANGCVSNNTTTISQPNPLVVSLSNLQNITCNGLSNGSINIATTGGTQPYSYNWNNGTLPNSSTQNNLAVGTYNIVVTDVNGCTQNANYIITQPTVLTSSISNLQNITCYGLTNGNITTTTLGGTPPYIYQWNNGATTSNNSNLSTGNYNLTITDNNGCNTQVNTTITQPIAITTTVSNSVIICPGVQLTLQAVSNGGTGLLSYHWNNGMSNQNISVSPLADTTYQVYSTDANGCVGPTASTTIEVNDILLSSLTVPPTQIICEGETAIVFASFVPGKGTYTYVWNNGLGAALGPFTVSPTTTTNYQIVVTDNCNNTISNEVLVQVNPLPEVALSPQVGVGCGSVEFNLQNNQSNPVGIESHWNFGDNTFSTTQNPIKSYNSTGSYTITLIVTNPFGCTELASTTINAIVNPVAEANFTYSPDEDLTTNNATLRFDNYSTNTTSYKWSFGDGATSIEISPTHTYQEKGMYDIILITNNNFNCADTLIKKVTIDPAYNFYVPNAFTPDADGLNEVFTAKGEEIKEFSMAIFNRWGEKICETHDLEKGWNGRAKEGNDVAQEGVYVYDIRLRDFTGKLHTMQGKVTLIK